MYGREGHRIATSFEPSFQYDFSTAEETRIIEVECADKTGTNDYVLLRITENTDRECVSEMHGQVSDGIFENCRTGKIEAVF